MEKIKEKISSLAEYINIIKKYDLSKHYFRGENQKYLNISSSLVRGYTHGDELCLSDIYYKLLQSYYQEVGYKLDKMQEENFLAFSQHHGLRTNLIDFTTAPLVALYFACERETYDVDSGFVYILNENNTIDASQFLREYAFKGHLCHNVFTQLAWDNPDIVTEFIRLLKSYVREGSGKNSIGWVYNMTKQIREYPELEKSNLYVKERDIIGRKKSLDVADEIFQLMEKYFPELNKQGDMGVIEFIGIFLMFFDDIRTSVLRLPPDIPFPKIPYFMYKTPLKFDRIRNQNGVFLYQAFVDYQISWYKECGSLMVQKIAPDMVIQVDKQKEIMKELDMAGINTKYIYDDFDNTAQYINMKLKDNG